MRKLRQAERTELSDQRMLDTAIQIILQRGIAGLRLTDVGLQAGYSRGLATMRFGTMVGLLRRVAERLHQRWLEELTKAVGKKVGLAAVYAAIDTQSRWLKGPAQDIRVQYLIFFHSMDPNAEYRLDVGRVVAGQRRDLARWIRDAIETGEVSDALDPDMEAAYMLSCMIGIIYQTLMNPDVRSAELFSKLKADISARLARKRTARPIRCVSPKRPSPAQGLKAS